MAETAERYTLDPERVAHYVRLAQRRGERLWHVVDRSGNHWCGSSAKAAARNAVFAEDHDLVSPFRWH